MKKLIAIMILLSFAAPVRAGINPDFDPVEKNLIQKKQFEEDMNKEFKKAPDAPIKNEPKKEEASSGSNWWKWTLGILVVGGIAAAAGGGKGGGSSSTTTTTGTTGTVTASW